MKSRIYFLVFTIIIGMFSLNTALASVVTDGLVSYWTFDNIHIIDKTVKDVWGDNNGTISGNPKVVPGHVGESLEFDGKGDFVNLTTLGEFGKQMGTFTFEAWIKTSNNTGWMTLINTHGAECPYWDIQLNGVKEGNVFRAFPGRLFFVNSLLPKQNGECTAFLIGTTSLNIKNRLNIYDGEWHHIVYTNEHLIEEGKSHALVYIDTKSNAKSTGKFGDAWTSFPFTEPVHLGARNFGGKPEGFFEGIIDEVRFYDRPLTLKEIRQNFESTTPYNVEPKGKLSTVWATIKAK
ncbi:MAG: LamG domain-containing protein [Candidatus Poribacteria bacterium]|nr:LamG domain-containing protein [Candidatus Poribacteria bacterium]